MLQRPLPLDLKVVTAASQTADVKDRAGGRHGTDDDADRADAGAGGRVRGGHGADGAGGSGADGTGTTPVPVPLRAQTGAAGGIALGLSQTDIHTTEQQKSDTPLPEDIDNRELPRMAASQTADVEDRAGGGHGTDDDADGADAGDGDSWLEGCHWFFFC